MLYAGNTFLKLEWQHSENVFQFIQAEMYC